MSDQSRMIGCSCLCGESEHEITLKQTDLPLKVYVCHCTSCRHVSGTLSLTLAALPGDFSLPEELRTRLVAYHFSKRIVQYHCPTCGTLTYLQIQNSDKSTAWGIATGNLQLLDEICIIKGHEHVADTLDGGMSDFLPSIDGNPLERWAHHFGKGEQTPSYWRSPETTKTEPSMSDRLHAHCHCGGVKFCITRPSERSGLPEKFLDHPYSEWPDLTIPYHTEPRPPPPREPWWLVKIKDGETKYLAGMCSCDSCRLGSGVEIVQWAFIPTTDIFLDAACTERLTLSADTKRTFGTLQWYRSSQGSTRGFCKVCGSQAMLAIHNRPEVVDVAVGLLDAPEGARAETWLHWHLDRLSYREDASDRAGRLVAGIEKGYELFKQQQTS